MEIYKTPHLVSLAGNPMRYGFHVGSNDPGIKPKLTITFTEKDTTVDHRIEIMLRGELRTFILKESPVLAYEIPVATVEETLSHWLGNILTAVQAIVEISDYYDVSLDGSDLIFESKAEDPQYDIAAVEKDPIIGVTCAVTPGEIGDPGVLSQLLLNFSEKDTEKDHKIELTVMGEDRALVTKPSPSAAWEIPVATEEETISEWVGRILLQLQDPQYEPGALYDIEDAEGNITITAKQANPYFDIAVKEIVTGITSVTVPGEAPAWDYGDEYTEGEKASSTWTFSATDEVEDHTMEATIMGQEKTFTLKVNVGDEYDLPAALHDESVDDWMSRIQTALQGIYLIGTNYDIVKSGVDLIITAKEFGSEFDIAIGDTTVTGISTDDQQATLPNWTYVGVLMQIRKDSATGTIIGEEYKPFDVNNSSSFDVAEYLYAELLNFNQRHFYNSLPSGIVKYYTDYVLQYYVSFFPRTANNEYGSKVSDIKRYALGGGFSREMLVKNNLSLIDWFNEPDNAKKFLTWCPDEKITDMQEKISLFFLVQYSTEWVHYEDTWMSVDILLSNGQTVQCYHAFTPTSNTFSVIEFTVGYTEILKDLDPVYIPPGVTVLKWDVCLKAYTDAVEEISETKTFILDPRYYENTRHFRFRNSFGSYDSLLCTGKFESFGEYERFEATYINFDNLEYDINAERFQTKVIGTKSKKANTGFINIDYLEYLNDFLLSRDIYEYVDGQLQRVLINSKKVNFVEDKVNNYCLSFEYQYASQNEFHSII
jgi:hypothetical protein